MLNINLPAATPAAALAALAANTTGTPLEQAILAANVPNISAAVQGMLADGLNNGVSLRILATANDAHHMNFAVQIAAINILGLPVATPPTPAAA